LRIDGDQFWKTLETIITQPYKKRLFSTFKLIFYPIKMCPDFLDPKIIVEGQEDVSLQLRFGVEGRFVIKKKLVVRYIKKMIAAGDPEFTIVVDFGEKKFRWNKYGNLCTFTSRLSDVLTAIEENTNLLHPQKQEDKKAEEPIDISKDIIITMEQNEPPVKEDENNKDLHNSTDESDYSEEEEEEIKPSTKSDIIDSKKEDIVEDNKHRFEEHLPVEIIPEEEEE